MEKDLREHERINISLEVVMESLSGNREVRLSDLSMTGCYIDSISSANKGDNIVFKVHLPTGEWLKLTGRVAYVIPNSGFGLSFINLSEEDQELLKQFILESGGCP